MNIGLIGFGRFGQLLFQYLKKDFNLIVYDKSEREKLSSLESCQIIILAVPISNMEDCLKEISPYIKKGSLVVDVCSVKETPLKLMKKYLSNDIQTLGTHPMFGPDSARETLSEAKIVLCKGSISPEKFDQVKNYLDNLGLQVVETSAKDHDEQISHSLLLTHLIGRTLINFGAKELEIDTKGYKRLLTVLEHVGNDSIQLFKDMNNYNSYAKELRSNFSKALEETIQGL